MHFLWQPCTYFPASPFHHVHCVQQRSISCASTRLFQHYMVGITFIVHICSHMHTHARTHTHTHTLAHTHTHTCIRTCTRTLAHTHTHTHTLAHMHTHTCIHTHTSNPSSGCYAALWKSLHGVMYMHACILILYFNSVGENGCTMNVHMLKHIPQCVQNWGPLWAYSCFSFESINGHLKKHFHGTRCMNAQVLWLHHQHDNSVHILYAENLYAARFLPCGSPTASSESHNRQSQHVRFVSV